MLQDEYYVMESENNDDYPMFSWDQASGDFGLGKPVEWKDPLKLKLSDPAPGFRLVDFHEAPAPVVSRRIVDSLLPLDLYGVQFVPAKVRNPEDKSFEPRDYWLIHVWNRIACLDREESDLELYDDGTIFGIEEFVLDEEKLEEVEPGKRMIFELGEKTSVLLVHETVKKAIESAEPKGIHFYKASEWYSDIAFDD